LGYPETRLREIVFRETGSDFLNWNLNLVVRKPDPKLDYSPFYYLCEIGTINFSLFLKEQKFFIKGKNCPQK
jgi:hypothetical protein